jgi:outer membrane protein
LAAAVAAVALLASAPAPAAEFKIAVVDQQQVLEKSKAGKRALDALKDFSASRQRIVTADDEELKKLESEIKAQESGPSESQRREKQELFRSKFDGYQRRLQDFNREIQVKQKELADEYQKRIEKATATIAEKGGYSVIMEKGNENGVRIVLYASRTIDLTDQVVKEFDRQNK